MKGANKGKLREGLETHAYNVEKSERLKRGSVEALSEARRKFFAARTTTTTNKNKNNNNGS